MAMFAQFTDQLDAHYDRRERIYKLSRDVTIEAKRIIFTLLRYSPKSSVESNVELFAQADQQFDAIRRILFAIAKELHSKDDAVPPFDFSRFWRYHYSFSPGMQELIEASTLYVFMKRLHEHRGPPNPIESGTRVAQSLLATSEELQRDFLDLGPLLNEDVTMQDATNSALPPPLSVSQKSPTEPMLFPIASEDYILGVADLSGELMRYATNSVTQSDYETTFTVLEILSQMLASLQSLGSVFQHKDMGFKITTLRQNVCKVEKLAYNIRVRGAEFPDAKMILSESGFMPTDSTDEPMVSNE